MAGTSLRDNLPLSAVEAPYCHRNQMQAFAELEERIAILLSVDAAKAIVARMCRIYLQHSYTLKGVEDARSEIPSIVRDIGNAEVTRLYEEFVNTWNEVEKRRTHQLPWLDNKGECDGGEVPDGAQNGTVSEQSGRNKKSCKTIRRQDPEGQQHNRLLVSIQTTGTLSSPFPPTSVHARKGSASPTTEALNLVPITNPEVFPLSQIQEVQAEYYPSLYITSIWLNLNASNELIQVTADVANGPVDYLRICDPRTIAFLGLSSSSPPTIDLQPNDRIDETYTIRLIPGCEGPRDHNAWVVGELVSARHAYLYWLEERNTADSKGPPMAAEARAIARKTRRRALDVMREIEKYWKMEYGSGGQRFREGRAVFLDEDPVFEGGGDGMMKKCMWDYRASVDG